MKSEKLGWNKAAVFICTKCGVSITGASKDLAEDLKKELKSEMKELGLAEDIRVMTSSCLNICEKEFQAVALIPKNDPGQAVVKLMNPFKDKEDLKKEIIKLKNL